MFSEERRGEILKKLQQDGRVLAKDLAAGYQVSMDSIRRDLRIMEQEGLLRRTHGGAVPLRVSSTPVEQVSHIGNEGTPDQQAIAKIAARFIKKDQIIFIGGAAVHEVMLKYLPQDIPYTIVTNAVEIASYTMKKKNIETYLIGGKVNGDGNMADALANQYVSLLRFHVCFPVAEALTENGLSTDTPGTALFYRNVCENANSIVILAEHDTFSDNKFAKVCPAEKLDAIITDRQTPAEKIDTFKALGIEVIVAVG